MSVDPSTSKTNQAGKEPRKQRFAALDQFRGATVVFMILVNNPGSWSHMYPPLQHAPWHGCTPTDLVFPFFLFAVGNALALVMSSTGKRQPTSESNPIHQENRGAIGQEINPRSVASSESLAAQPLGSTVTFASRVAKRTILIFAIGLFLNASPFLRWNEDSQLVFKSFETLRVMGVLQRIALAFGLSAILAHFFLSKEKVLIVACSMLLMYWGLCWGLGDKKDPYSVEGFWGTMVDRHFLGESHMYKEGNASFDPEGLVSTIPCIPQVLFGWWIGRLIIERGTTWSLVRRLLVIGGGFVMAACLWQQFIPINKKLWTPSFVTLSTGFAILTLVLFIVVTELFRVAKPIGRAFESFGKNPLFIFVLSGLVPRFNSLFRWESADSDGIRSWQTPLTWLYKCVFAPLSSDPRFGSLVYSIAVLVAYWFVVAWMDRCKIYIRV